MPREDGFSLSAHRQQRICQVLLHHAPRPPRLERVLAVEERRVPLNPLRGAQVKVPHRKK